MNDHSTWFDLLPGYLRLQEYLSHTFLKREWQTVGLAESDFKVAHVAISMLITLFLITLAMRFAARVSRTQPGRLVPEARFGVRNGVELLTDATFSLAEGVMGLRNAERFLPLLGTFVFFILFNNLIGLIPGFVPPTSTLKTNLALSGLVFVATHVMGLKEHGLPYLKHFAGPIWWLAPLMLPIELVSHIVRPISLALRLMGNMFADHQVLSTFFFLVPLVVPMPFYVLGILVSVVQTLVFTLLSMIYIEQAVAHEAH